MNKENRIEVPADEEISEEKSHTACHSGYLSVRSGGQLRHVGNTFWGLITGHVSLPVATSCLYVVEVTNNLAGSAL